MFFPISIISVSVDSASIEIIPAGFINLKKTCVTIYFGNLELLGKHLFFTLSNKSMLDR